AVGGKPVLQVAALQFGKARLSRKRLAHGQCDCKRTTQRLQDGGLNRIDDRVLAADPLYPLDKPHALSATHRPGHEAGRGGPETRPRADPGRPFDGRLGHLRPGDARHMVEALKQGGGGRIMRPDRLFLQLHLVSRRSHPSTPGFLVAQIPPGPPQPETSTRPSRPTTNFRTLRNPSGSFSASTWNGRSGRMIDRVIRVAPVSAPCPAKGSSRKTSRSVFENQPSSTSTRSLSSSSTVQASAQSSPSGAFA